MATAIAKCSFITWVSPFRSASRRVSPEGDGRGFGCLGTALLPHQFSHRKHSAVLFKCNRINTGSKLRDIYPLIIAINR